MPLKGLTASSWANQLPFSGTQRNLVLGDSSRALACPVSPAVATSSSMRRCRCLCRCRRRRRRLPALPAFTIFILILHVFGNHPTNPLSTDPSPEPAQWPLLKPLRPMPHCVLLCQIVYEKLRMTPPPMEMPSMPSAHKSSRLG